jgi:hypothetical protein
VIVVGVGDRLLGRAVGHGGALAGGRVGEAFGRVARGRVRGSRDEAVQVVVGVGGDGTVSIRHDPGFIATIKPMLAVWGH